MLTICHPSHAHAPPVLTKCMRRLIADTISPSRNCISLIALYLIDCRYHLPIKDLYRDLIDPSTGKRRDRKKNSGFMNYFFKSSWDSGEWQSNSNSFYLLANLVEDCGYQAHLLARNRLSIHGGSWMDLMMWSVLAGHFKLSRVIWLHTHHPMRAAVMARRVCSKLMKYNNTAFHDEFDEQSLEYERWAVGILNQIELTAEATELLTCIETSHIPQKLSDDTSTSSVRDKSTFNLLPFLGFSEEEDRASMVSVWTASVLDEAIKFPSPCRNVVAHRHTQSVLECYFTGFYRGSRAAIPINTRISHILLNLPIHILNLPLLGLLPELHKTFEPIFPSLVSDEDDTLAEEELDEDYFKEAPPKPAVSTGFNFYMWLYYFSIPKVNYTLHSMFSLLCIFLCVFYLLVDQVDENSRQAMRNHGLMVPAVTYFGKYNSHNMIEVLFWVFYVGRIVEELGQLRTDGLSEYLSTFWNWIDLSLMAFNSISLCLRLVSLFAFLANFTWGGCAAQAIIEDDCLLTWNMTSAEASQKQGALAWVMNTHQHSKDFMVIGMILLVWRYIEILVYIPVLGESVLVLFAMIQEAIPVLAMMLLVAMVTGISFGISMSMDASFTNLSMAMNLAKAKANDDGEGGNGTEFAEMYRIYHDQLISKGDASDGGRPDGFFELPWAFGLWSTLGEFGDVLQRMYDAENVRRQAFIQSGQNAAQFSGIDWLPVLLWISTFLITVLLVNLMIAKMTSTYEKIRERTLAYRALQRASLIAEFKDDRGAPPPMNLVTSFFRVVSCGFTEYRKSITGYHVARGKTATLRQQARERFFRNRFNYEDLEEKHSEIGARIADMHSRLAAIEAVSQLQAKAPGERGIMGARLEDVSATQRLILSRLNAMGAPDPSARRRGGPEVAELVL